MAAAAILDFCTNPNNLAESSKKHMIDSVIIASRITARRPTVLVVSITG